MPQHSTWRLDWWSGGNPVPRRIQEWQMVYLPILMVCSNNLSIEWYVALCSCAKGTIKGGSIFGILKIQHWKLSFHEADKWIAIFLALVMFWEDDPHITYRTNRAIRFWLGEFETACSTLQELGNRGNFPQHAAWIWGSLGQWSSSQAVDGCGI